MRIFLIVIDSFGIGELPDAGCYGDSGSNTYVNIVKSTNLYLPNLIQLGLNNIDGISDHIATRGKTLQSCPKPRGAYARLAEKTFAKDTTAGHYEIAGLVMDKPYGIYKTFPREIVEEIEKKAATKFIGNEVASGTEIIQRLGEKHLQTGCPILYTSQDSVMQIAADISVIPLQRLYEICRIAREIMVGDRAVGRIIARPFTHENGRFFRTDDRKDYALSPPGETMLDVLSENGITVTAIGKISDIFCGRGITNSIHTSNNRKGIAEIIAQVRHCKEGLIFANLVDTDMLYGHRNDVKGYADALRYFDEKLPSIIAGLQSDDVLLITADHGCDPTTPSTDHSREYTPLLIYGNQIIARNLGTIYGFDCIAEFILTRFQCSKNSIIMQKLEECF